MVSRSTGAHLFVTQHCKPSSCRIYGLHITFRVHHERILPVVAASAFWVCRCPLIHHRASTFSHQLISAGCENHLAMREERLECVNSVDRHASFALFVSRHRKVCHSHARRAQLKIVRDKT